MRGLLVNGCHQHPAVTTPAAPVAHALAEIEAQRWPLGVEAYIAYCTCGWHSSMSVPHPTEVGARESHARHVGAQR